MKIFEVMKHIHDYLESTDGGGYTVDLVPTGVLPCNNNNVKMMYQLTGLKKPVRLAGSLDGEQVQITFVAPKNNKDEIIKLVGVINGVRNYVREKSYRDKEVRITSDPITIKYMAGDFLPAVLINMEVNYKTN